MVFYYLGGNATRYFLTLMPMCLWKWCLSKHFSSVPLGQGLLFRLCRVYNSSTTLLADLPDLIF